MSTQTRRARRLKNQDSSESNHSIHSIKSTYSLHDYEEYNPQRRLVDRADDSDVGAILDQDFEAVGIAESLEVDPRPTFVVTLDVDFADGIELIFANKALSSNYQSVESVFQHSRTSSCLFSPGVSSTAFRSWVIDSTQQRGETEHSIPPTFPFCGALWTAFTVRSRWTIISGVSASPEAKVISGTLPLRSGNPSNASLSSPQWDHIKENRLARSRTAPVSRSTSDNASQVFITTGTPDWTIAHPVGVLSPHVMFARQIDWGSTPLGDMNLWSPEFRQVANLVMDNPHPCALFWGEELTVMYNKAYADGVAGHKHPPLMGTGFRGPFAELWDTVGAIFQECVQSGKSVAMKEQMLPIERHGYLEETFFTWSLTPLYGGTNELLGLYNAPFETTRQTINDRRTRTLLRLSEEVALAKSVETFWPLVLNGFKENEFDFPFALLYSIIDDLDTEDGSSMSSGSSHAMKSCVLQGTLGIPEGHAAAPSKLDLKRSRGGFIPAFRDAMQTREPKMLNIVDGTLSESLVEGLEWRGFGDPCKLAIVSPIRPTTSENILGFLVIGEFP